MHRFILSFCLVGLLSAPAAEVLCSFDTLDGVSLSWVNKVDTNRVEIVQGEGLSSDGGGALRLVCHSGTAAGNHYFGAFVRLPKPMDLRDKALHLDARGRTPQRGAFYLRAYNVGETKPAWSFTSWNGLLKDAWQTFRFQPGLCPEGPAWEAEVVEGRTATAIDRIELIIGTAANETDLEASFDRLTLADPIGTLTDLKAVTPQSANTPLVREGKPLCTILHPEGEAGVQAATRLAAAVQAKSGVALPLRPGTRQDLQPTENVILLGSVNTNPALQLLYARRLTPVDSFCPGQGGALAHTVCDPFGKGVNAVVAGAADAVGLAKATDLLVAAIAAQPAGPNLTLPRLFERAYGTDFLKAYAWAADKPAPNRLAKGLAEGQLALDRGQHCSIAGILASVANRYRLTGHSVEATLFVQLWDLYATSAVADPRKYGGPWGFDSDFMSREVVTGWDVIEDDPALTDEDRLKTLKAMSRWITDAVVPECASAARSTHVNHNHQTFPSLGCLFAGLYLTQHYPTILEGSVWLELADAAFRKQATAYKPMEDCNGYQWLTNSHLFHYAVARPDLTVFENGNAGRIIDFCIGNMDNLGYQVPYGDTGSWVCWNSETVCLDIMAFVTRSPEALWAANFKRQVKSSRLEAGDFSQFGTAPLPTRYDGVHAWPLEPQYYTSHNQEPRPPLAQCVDKVSFRERMDPQAWYLLLDGLSNGGHKHYDGNSIPRITAFDRIWLADNDYFKSPLKYHNSIMVIRDGQSAVIPAYVELQGAGESATVGYSRTRVSGYAGADWERAIVWLKPQRAFVVLDRLTALTDGEYQFRLLWHGVGQAELGPDGMQLTQKGPGLWVQVARGPQLSLQDDAELGKNWTGYKHADPVVRSLTATASVRLTKDGSQLFATVFHGGPAGPGDAWPMQFLERLPGLLLNPPSGPVAVGFGAVDVSLTAGHFVSDANVVVAGVQGLSLLGATRATLAERPLLEATAAPRCVDLANADLGAAVTALPRAAPPAPSAAAAALPELPVLWTATPAPSSYILSGNQGITGTVPGFASMSAEPAPAAQNVFAPESPNAAAALSDGTWASTADSVMFPPDQPVTVRLAFKSPATVNQVIWQQWWAATSSRKTAYLLAKATLEASNDGFTQDIRSVATLTEPGTHPDFGSTVRFELDAGQISAKDLRLRLEPQPGSAIYLGEVIASGRLPEGLTPTGGYTFTSATPARLLPNAPAAVVLTTSQGELVALSATGQALWSRTFPCQLNDVAATDVDGDGIDELALARQDFRVSLLKADGNPVWDRELQYYRVPPYVNLVRTGDLDGDGHPEIIAGGNNWRFYAFTAAGVELWNYEAVHPSRSGAVSDLDGDGKAEVLCGTHYYSMTALKPDGTRKWTAGFGPICFDIATGAFDGDGTRGVLCGSGDSGIYLFDAKGQQRLALVTGDEVRTVATADMDGDGRDEALAGGFSHLVYCFDGQGKPRWRVDLGEPVAKIVPVKTPAGTVLVAGTTAGMLATLDGTGAWRASRRLEGAVTSLTALGDTVVVSTSRGQIRCLRPLP